MRKQELLRKLKEIREMGVWRQGLKDIIRRYGYADGFGRLALKKTLSYGASSGLRLNIDGERHTIEVIDSSGEPLGVYDLYQVIDKFMVKLGRVLYVVADRQIKAGKEFFHYKEFYVCSEPQSKRFLEAFKKGYAVIDLRMHLKESGAVRNHGTAFRVREDKFMELYDRVEKLEL